MTTDERKSVSERVPEDARLSVEQRVRLLSRKLERFRESQDKKDRAAREWAAEIERELAELKSSLVS